MISYEPLFKTLKKRNISIYKLINTYHISRGTIDNLKHNRSITMSSLNQLMETLGITNITEVIHYTPDTTDTPDESDMKQSNVSSKKFLSTFYAYRHNLISII